MAKITFKNKLILGAFILFFVANAASAQSTASPFDLVPRLEVSADSAVVIPVSTNPFDIISIAPRPGQRPRTGMWIPENKKAKPISAKEKETQYRRFLFVSILIMFIILTLIVTIFRILIQKIWKAFLNDNLLNQLHREQSAGLALAYLILYLLFFINGGLFAFLSARHFGISISSSNLYALLICMGCIAGFFVAKHFVLWLLGFIFPISKEVDSYQFTIMVFNTVLGLFLVPVVLFIAYAPPSYTGMVAYGALALLGLTYLFLSLRGLFIATRFIGGNKFHFLLYLCAVEIAPLLVIYKIATAYGGN